jgi:ABC-type protease/lipase transport system fused ATPase/permease subunit
VKISTEQSRIALAYKATTSFRMPAVVLLLIGLVSNVLTLTGSIFMLQVYDRVLASRSLPTLVVLTALVAVLYGFYALLEWTRMRMSARVANMVDRLLSQKMFEAAADRRPAAGAERNADPIRDLDTIRTFISGSGPLAVLDLPWLPAYLALVFIFHPMFGWLVTAGAVVITGMLVLNETQSRRTAREMSQAVIERQALSTAPATTSKAFAPWA